MVFRLRSDSRRRPRAVKHFAAVGRLASGVGVLLLLVVAATLGVSSTPAASQETPTAAGPLECGGPVPVVSGVGVDCFVTLDQALSDGMEAVAVAPSGVRTRCRDLVGLILCPDIAEGAAQPGVQDVRLLLVGPDGAESEVAAGSFETVGMDDLHIDLGLSEPVVFEGHPLKVLPTQAEPVPRVFLLVRARNEAEVLLTAPLADVEGGQTVEIDLPVGRYRAWPCVGFYAETCTEMAGGHAFQVIAPDPVALLPGHNRSSGQRINILFVASGFDVGTLPEVARTLLTLDGPITSGSELFYGPMAIEPLASNLDRFNFWLLPEEIADEEALLDNAGQARSLDGFDLSNLQVTTLYVGRTVGERPPTDARTTSFYGRYEVPSSDRIDFGGVRLAIDPTKPHLSAQTLAHEWGHGLFDLRDEYNGFDDRGVTTRYPNCAPDLATAQSWWGDQLGDVDPFVYDVIEARADAGLRLDHFDKPLVELVRVDFVSGGCLGALGAQDAYRPTSDSLMNSELPVFGSVNRQRVEEVLDQFSGRGMAQTPDDLIISCVTKNDRLFCDGRLRSHLDPPEGGMAIGDVPCRFDRDVEPVSISCEGPAPVHEIVTISLGIERGRVNVVNVDPPPSTSTDPTTTAPAVQGLAAPDPEASMSGFWLTVGGSVTVASGLLVLGRRRSAQRQ